MGLAQVPKPIALTPFVMQSFQCFVASSLAQSMPHSCSFRDPWPMCFPFSNSGYMPATKIKSLHSTAGSENIWQFCCQNLFHKGDHSFKMCLQTQNHLKNNEHFETTWFLLLSARFISFLTPEFQEAHPLTKWILKQHVPLNILKQNTKISCPCTNSQNNPKTLPGPRPFLSAASTVAPAEISCSTTAAWCPWAAKCSAVRPRAPRMRPRRRGCCGCRGETKRIVMGCFSGWLGKILGHKYQICQADAFSKSFSVRHGEKKRSNHRKICSCTMVLFKSYKQLHLTFSTSCVTCLKIISWITLDYPISKCSEIRTCLTKECQEKRKSCEVRCGVETQCEVRLGGRHESHWTSISAKRNLHLHCPLYSEKEGLCRVETYLIGTGLKTKGFGVYCARLESPNIHQYQLFHSEGLKPTDVIF